MPTAVLTAAFADLGFIRSPLRMGEDVPGEGQLIHVPTAVAVLLAHLAQLPSATPAATRTRLAQALWA
ncbi:MAG: hypothetical protein ACTHMP_20130 [Thermomicrobiales bacterium]